ncbi:transcriptional-regulating factor 1-like isoform X2 [Echeneis naucrates]|nr:transcriptional-regulating factor 1-like isoform X2 [Echeneis naucrates]
MDDHSSPQPFPNLQPHRHRSAFHLSMPTCQSPDASYPPVLDSLEQYGTRGEQSILTFPTSSTSSRGRRGSSGGNKDFHNTCANTLDGNANLGDHLDADSRLASYFTDPWYVGDKKDDVWEDGEHCQTIAEDFISKADCYSNENDVFYPMNCGTEDGHRRRLRTNYNSYAQVSCEAKSQPVYNREADVSRFTKQTSSHSRCAAGSFSDSSVDYCRTDSRVSDSYLGREEDYGSSCGSGEDHLPAAEVDGPWLSVSPSGQTGEGRWRGAEDTVSVAPGCQPLRSPTTINSGTYTQKLDSFSEAFLSQRKRTFPMISGGESSAQMWDFGGGRVENSGSVKSRHSCAFDSESYLPSSSSSSSAHPSLPSFPSPPTSSHFMSSVLSPPPTPLPPPSHSPSKMDSPKATGGTGHSVSQEGEPLGALQFFTSRLQSLPSAMLWKFSVLPHSFPHSLGDPSSNEGTLTSSHGADYGNINAPHDVHQSPELSLLTFPSHHSSRQPPPRPLCPVKSPPLHPSLHLSSSPSHSSAEKMAAYSRSHKVMNEPATVNQLQPEASPVYTGTPFSSVLHSSRVQKRDHYIPRPLLNPVRKGTGLYSSLSPLNHREDGTCRAEEEDGGVLQHVNVGPDFQAELPSCFIDGKESAVPREELLWKPLEELDQSANLQHKVEKLLSMCSSSCLPGGGSNTELALHCLHYCQGNTMATLEILLFSKPSPTGDYHYSGSDIWTATEKSLFSTALGIYGKDFSLIQKMVSTKTVSQCVEFYYLSKKLQDKKKKQKEEEYRDGELEQQKSTTPVCQPMEKQYGLAEAVPLPSLASFFPCKLCGKMFYKIKSRNAHMKIHRQPQEDWADRRLQHHLLTQRLALSHSTNLLPTSGTNVLPPQTPALTFPCAGLAGTPGSNCTVDNVLSSVTNSNTIAPSNASVRVPSNALTYGNTAASNSHVIPNTDTSDSNQRQPTSIIPFHQSWGSFGPGSNPAAFYCNTEGKGDTRTVGGKDPTNWQ